MSTLIVGLLLLAAAMALHIAEIGGRVEVAFGYVFVSLATYLHATRQPAWLRYKAKGAKGGSERAGTELGTDPL